METKQKETILDELGITQEKAVEIHQYIFNLIVENNSPSKVLVECVRNLDLNTKELVLASFFAGQIHQMTDKQFTQLAEMYEFKKTAESILNRFDKLNGYE